MRARFCFRQARTIWSPSCMCARQNRETSRAQASCPSFCCADAPVAIRTKGTTKRILLICYALVPGERNPGVLEPRSPGRNAFVAGEIARQGRFMNVVKGRKRLRRIAASVPRSTAGRSLLGQLAGLLRGEIAVHHGAAVGAQIGAMLHHAGGDLRNVRDFRAAKAKRVTGAL